MTTVTQANVSVSGIEQEIREFVGISSGSILPSSTIQEELNYQYTVLIPDSIKLDQLRTVYEFFTVPFCDRYPMNNNQYQSFRDPCYVDGIPLTYYQDRKVFYGYWPDVPTYINPGQGDGVTTTFNFTIGGTPICRTRFMCSVPDITGHQMIVRDSPIGTTAQGNLLLIQTDSTGLNVPPFPPTSPIPPSPLPPVYNPVNIGSINYVTGIVQINWPVAPMANELLRCNYFSASTGRPISLLWWNNELIVRPIPKYSHRIEVEAYQTPASFLMTTDTPILNDFKRYLSLATAITICQKTGDNMRAAELQPMFDKMQGEVLNRQANAEIGQANATIFNQQSPVPLQYPYGGYWY